MAVQTYSKEYVESLIAEKDKHIESLQAKVHLCAGYDKLLADLIQTEEELNKSEAENIKLLQRNEKLQYRMAEFELRNELLEAVYEAAQAHVRGCDDNLYFALVEALAAVQTGN